MTNNILFFGDSFTSAENNNYNGFVEKLNLENKGYHVVNYGVSGTTLAPYSLYPVGPNDLLALIREHEEEIKNASVIFIEYGINDFASYITSHVRLYDIELAFTNCIDYLRQLNTECKIIYLVPSHNPKVIESIAESQVDYLEHDYLKLWRRVYSKEKFVFSFLDFIHCIESCEEIKVLDMITDEEFMNKYICNDNIHPNDYGYQIIADTILRQLIKGETHERVSI